MNSKAPPVPPANRSDKGTGNTAPEATDPSHGVHEQVPDPEKQGQPGNTAINLTPRLKNQDR